MATKPALVMSKEGKAWVARTTKSKGNQFHGSFSTKKAARAYARYFGYRLLF